VIIIKVIHWLSLLAAIPSSPSSAKPRKSYLLPHTQEVRGKHQIHALIIVEDPSQSKCYYSSIISDYQGNLPSRLGTYRSTSFEVTFSFWSIDQICKLSKTKYLNPKVWNWEMARK